MQSIAYIKGLRNSSKHKLYLQFSLLCVYFAIREVEWKEQKIEGTVTYANFIYHFSKLSPLPSLDAEGSESLLEEKLFHTVKELSDESDLLLNSISLSTEGWFSFSSIF